LIPKQNKTATLLDSMCKQENVEHIKIENDECNDQFKFKKEGDNDELADVVKM
jgi:hypothetical protein